MVSLLQTGSTSNFKVDKAVGTYQKIPFPVTGGILVHSILIIVNPSQISEIQRSRISMFSPKYKPFSVLGILIVSLTILLCSPWAAIAQIGEQRLIPLANESLTRTTSRQNLLTCTKNNSLRRLWTCGSGSADDKGPTLTPHPLRILASHPMLPTYRYQTHWIPNRIQHECRI